MLPRGDTLRAARPRVSAARKLEPSEPLYRPEFPRYGNSLLALALTTACIIPDTGIEARGEAVNPGPVRLVQAIPVSSQADRECHDRAPELDSCPLLPPSATTGLLRADVGEFCSCPEVDNHRINHFDIYAEDPDVDRDGNPVDSIYGAFLLDMPAGADDPSSFVAYENLLSPVVPATPEFGVGSYADAFDRPTPQVRRWTIDDGDGRVDLCNNNASSPNATLEPGLHTLRLIVTDRPWYRPFQYDSNGEIKIDKVTKQRLQVPPEEAAIGVPDTPAGASYASADFVFRCEDGFAEVPEGTVGPCQCVEASMEGEQ